MPRTFGHTRALRVKFQNLRLRSGQNPVALMLEFERLAAELGNLGQPVHEGTILAAFLAALLPRAIYRDFLESFFAADSCDREAVHARVHACHNTMITEDRMVGSEALVATHKEAWRS